MDNEYSKEKPQGEMDIQADTDIITGKFTNYSNILYTEEEFCLDFLFVQKQPSSFGKMVSRMILTPKHAKRLLYNLQNNIINYEEKFGNIESKTSQSNSDFNNIIQ